MASGLAFFAAAERNLSPIFDHLFDSYCAFGELPGEALNHAAAPVLRLRGRADRLCIASDCGTKRHDTFSGLRHLTIERAIFGHVVDDPEAVVQVLAVFLGDQDRVRQMLLRVSAD